MVTEITQVISVSDSNLHHVHPHYSLLHELLGIVLSTPFRN